MPIALGCITVLQGKWLALQDLGCSIEIRICKGGYDASQSLGCTKQVGWHCKDVGRGEGKQGQGGARAGGVQGGQGGG